ncbi:helix-turn-helix transcriptional regulator [Lapillicoccus sp.]|uniref:helix-turn-helix domain-containing protein n=1 Tax=Lapillicoccus sp. TaxID=1909287 RepID=UPI00344B5021
MTPSHSSQARIIALRPVMQQQPQTPPSRMPVRPVEPVRPTRREPLWRNIIGDVLRQERLLQERTLKDVSESARISMPYLSEIERGRKEASSEVLAAAAAALGMRLVDLLERAQWALTRAADSDPFAVTRVTQVTSVLGVSPRHTGLSGSVSLAA